MGAQQGGPGFGNAPQAQVAPQAPASPRFGRGQGRQGDQGFGPAQGNRRGMMGQGMMGRRSGPGIFGIFGMLFGLAKLVAFGLLAWLLLRTFMQRRNAPPAAPPATTPAGHDPTVE
jgi:predicted lipid-binding transport protein (Tim44 family)